MPDLEKNFNNLYKHNFADNNNIELADKTQRTSANFFDPVAKEDNFLIDDSQADIDLKEIKEYKKTASLSSEQQYECTRKIVCLRQEYHNVVKQALELIQDPVLTELKDSLINIYQSQHKRPRKKKLDNLNDLINFFTNYEINSFFLDALQAISDPQAKDQIAFRAAKQDVVAKNQVYLETVNTFLAHFQALCHKIAYQYTTEPWQKDLRQDAAQEGWIVLRRAADLYNPDKEIKKNKQATFFSYSIIALVNRIKIFIATDKTIQPPQHEIEREQKINVAIVNYKHSHKGREPSLTELSRITGFSTDVITNTMLRQKDTLPLHAARRKKSGIGEDEDTSYIDILGDPKAELAFDRVVSQADKKILFKVIEDILKSSPLICLKEANKAEEMRNRAQQVFNLYFNEWQTFEEIASKLKTTKQTISNTFKNIFRVLRQSGKIERWVINALEKLIKDRNFTD